MEKSKTVYVAMSGGVDSSVAAALLKKAAKPKDFEKIFGRAIPKGFSGFQVVGVFMKPWQSQSSIVNHQSLNDCLWKQDREDALRVAAKLDIPLLTWDLSKEYEKHVAQYMIEGYRQGKTPNPDIMCNKFIKFGVFLDKALKLGADYIATGHYVRLSTNSEFITNKRISESEKIRKFANSKQIRYSLTKARDLNKDQSYFLYTLTQKQLKYCLFPIGDHPKTEVRKLAKKFELPNWNKKDSQGLCFVGPLEVSKFLKKHIQPRKGSVLRKSDGKILGEHDGAWFYTIGQRHGIRIARLRPSAFGNPNAPIRIENSKAYYVIDKDIKKNILYVDDLENQKSKIKNQNYNSKFKSLQIQEFNWLKKEKLPLDCKVKTRYRQEDLNCTIVKNGSNKALVEIKENHIPIAPGQSAVFYKGNEVLGGGIIS